MKSTSLNCLKYMMFFFNLLFFILGVAALALGIWAVVNEYSFQRILTNNSIVFAGVYIIIAAGAALTLIGFLGCCGAVKENRCMLGTFFVIMLIIFIVQLAGTIYIYIKRDEVIAYVGKTIGEYDDGTANGKMVKQGWDTLQNSMQCCGSNNFTDWKNNSARAARSPGKLVPDSCCKRDMKNVSSPILNVAECQAGSATYLNTQGCVNKFKSSLQMAGIVAAVVLVVELLGMIFACCLYQHVNDYDNIA